MNDEAEFTETAAEPLRTARRNASRRWRLPRFVIVGAMTILGAIALMNYALLERPVSKDLADDPRNSGYSLHAHYQFYTNPNVLVLDLTDVREAAPIDLMRGVFQAAKVLETKGRRFRRVVLARARKPVFVMTGDAFSSIGSEYGAGQNPIYLIRTLPEKLYRPSGEPAFGKWEGGWLGVLGKQMEDANAAAREWMSAH
jgi:hypothetical protein